MWKILNFAEIKYRPGVLSPLDGIAEVTSLPPSLETLEKELPGFDGFIPSLEVRLERDLIERCPRLCVVATPSTGWDHLDTASLKERGVHLISLRDETEFLSSVTCTAEMAWALLLAVVRKLPWSFEAAKRGDWARDRFRGHQLSGMTLGILGYGRLGRIAADYGKAFRMRVIACDRRSTETAAGVELVDFDKLIRNSDVLSIHIHLTPENRGLIDREAIARMKPGAIILNTSRGAIIDESALLDALESGHLGGAGLDVVHGEWDEDLTRHPLIQYAQSHENLVISPHTGGVTFEAQAMTLEFLAGRLADYLRSLG
jgi:D-3-phosphoglycerate dehydrogenase